MSFADQLKNAIQTSGMSRYRLVQRSGGRLSESGLSNFISGRSGLSMAKMEVLTELLSLRIVSGREKRKDQAV